METGCSTVIVIGWDTYKNLWDIRKKTGLLDETYRWEVGKLNLKKLQDR